MKKILLLIIAGTLIGGLLFFMMNRGTTRVPANLLGMWVTDSAGYEDRYMIMEEENLIFGTGGNNSDHYFVNRVRENNDNSEIYYTVYYENDEKTEFRLKFTYKTEQYETIIINHMENIIWTKN